MRKVYPARVAPARLRAAGHAGDDYGAPGEPSWREVDWRRHLRFLDVAGRRVNVVEIGDGDGPPVVLVHGLGGQWQNWLENIPRLAQERRVVAIDLPGFGASDMPAEKISIQGYGRCVDDVCEQLDLGRVELVGNSMGGFVVAEVAISFPERAHRLALVSAAGISTASVQRRPVMTAARVVAAVTARTAARHREFAKRPALRHQALMLVARHPSRLRPDMAWEGLITGIGREGFMDALGALLDYDFRERVPNIHCPALIVWGDKDMVLPVADANEFARLIPGARKVVMEDTGHIPMVERPTAFNECLLDFLSEQASELDAEPGAAVRG